MRAVINAIFYVLVAGCAWSLLPHDFPKWKTVYHYFRQWRINDAWERIHEQLRQWVQAIEDRHPSPSAAVLDNQSVETATMIHLEVGYDAGKQVKGRKRHIWVDILGLLMVVVVTAQERGNFYIFFPFSLTRSVPPCFNRFKTLSSNSR